MDRDRRFELFALAEAAPLMALAEEVLGTAAVAVLAPPTVGMLMLRLRDPVAGGMFNAGEVLVTEARATLGPHHGYAMRLGREPEATLAAAVLDATLAAGHPLAPRTLALLAATADAARVRTVAAWRVVAPTRLRSDLDGDEGEHLAADIPGVHDDAAMRAVTSLLGLARAGAVDTSAANRHVGALVDQIMGEGGLYAPDLAARAVAQADGDPAEAAFLLRAYRTTLPRFGYTPPAEESDLRPYRRISPIYKEVVGGQVLGRTRDYTQRLLDVREDTPEDEAYTTYPHNGVTPGAGGPPADGPPPFPRIIDTLRADGMVPIPVPSDTEPFDITRRPLRFPAPRAARLQTLARGETGFLVGMAYSVMRGFGAAHPVIAELRQGELPVRLRHPLTGATVAVGAIILTEVDTISYAPGVLGAKTARRAAEATAGRYFHQGYGVAFGANERKAIAMGILDLNLNTPNNAGPAASEEFVLSHCDGLAASGLVEHLKLPHYVGFQSVLDRVRFRRLAALAGTGGMPEGSRAAVATVAGGGGE